MKYLKVIRYQNLILLALMQLILRFGFLNEQNCDLALTNFQYILLVVATLLIAAGGYVINDIFDQDTDAINKPEKVIIGKSIKESEAYKIFTSECRCNNCMTYFESDDDLIDGEDEDGAFKGCPKCNTDKYLMNLADLK